jgi:hypothetical protein
VLQFEQLGQVQQLRFFQGIGSVLSLHQQRLDTPLPD